jgi:hypothetical protein
MGMGNDPQMSKTTEFLVICGWKFTPHTMQQRIKDFRERAVVGWKTIDASALPKWTFHNGYGIRDAEEYLQFTPQENVHEPEVFMFSVEYASNLLRFEFDGLNEQEVLNDIDWKSLIADIHWNDPSERSFAIDTLISLRADLSVSDDDVSFEILSAKVAKEE